MVAEVSSTASRATKLVTLTSGSGTSTDCNVISGLHLFGSDADGLSATLYRRSDDGRAWMVQPVYQVTGPPPYEISCGGVTAEIQQNETMTLTIL